MTESHHFDALMILRTSRLWYYVRTRIHLFEDDWWANILQLRI